MSKTREVVGNTPSPAVTEDRQDGETPGESKELYRSMIELSLDSIFTIDTKGVITLCNAAATRLLGYSKDELVGKHFSKLGTLRLRDIPKYLKIFRSVLGGSIIEPTEVAFHRKDGTTRLVDVHVISLKVGGKTIIQTTARDITERKRMEAALQKQTYALSERVKELNCLYGIASIAERPDITLDEVYREGTNLMPASWQYPEITCSRITITEDEFRTANWGDTRWNQSSDIKVHGVKVGMVEVGYLEERPAIDEGPFLKEERLLIDAVAERLGKITERKQMEQRIEHLNRVLQAIRNVNQLIAREKDRDRLIKGICNNLVETRGYYSAWLAILDESGGLVTTAEAGLGKDFLPLVEQLKRGELPNCTQRALRQSEVMVTEDPLSTCVGCPLAGVQHSRGIMTVRLEHGGKVYGVLAVSMPKTLTVDEEEQSLTKEVASDIAYALHNIELEEERKRAEEALRQSEENLRAYLESAPDGVYLNDLNGTFLYGNKKAEEIMGYNREELVGKSFLKLNILPAKHLAKASKLLTLNLMGRPTGPDEFELIRKDINRVWVEINTVPIKQEGKTVVLGFVRDITERKQAEEALQEAEERYRSLVNNVKLGVFRNTLETGGRFLEINPAMEGITGYSREELLQMKVIDLYVHPEEREAFIEKVTSTAGRVTREPRFRKRDGTEIVASVTTVAVRNDTGKILYVDGIMEDITERKRMEEALQESEEKYRSLFEDANDAILLADTETGYVLDANREAERLLGYSKKEIRNMHQSQLHPPDKADYYKDHFGKHVEARHIVDYDAEVIRKDGTIVPVYLSASVIQLHGRKLIQGIFRDVTEVKRVQEALQEKTRQLAAASQTKSEFLASISHELRTPLNAVIGFSELMLDGVPGEINDEQRDCLNDILSSGQQLLNLINDVLDLSKIEAGKMELKLENLNLADVINDVVQTVKPKLDENRHKIGVSVGEGLPQVHADKRRLRQILLNLLSNAIKFTPPGGKLGIKVTRNGDWCQVSVVDNGIGIKKEDQEWVFEVFAQVATLPKEKEGGTGLGLALTKQFVEAIGGRIWVESEYGKGSKFTFTLPLAREGESYPERG